MNIDILSLNESLVPNVKGLIAGYINSSFNGVDESDTSPEQLGKCEQILNSLISNKLAQCYLAKHDQEYVGFIVLSWSFSISKGYPVLRIDALYASPLHRNKGVGRKLMQHAIDLAIENNATRLQLETDDNNIPASTLYKSLGFKLIPGKGVTLIRWSFIFVSRCPKLQDWMVSCFISSEKQRYSNGTTETYIETC